jgi:Flp pilus assembly protein TadG
MYEWLQHRWRGAQYHRQWTEISFRAKLIGKWLKHCWYGDLYRSHQFGTAKKPFPFSRLHLSPRQINPHDGRRKGTILVITAIVLIALVGLLGLVISGGQLMSAHRTAQNAADAGATAAALDLLGGRSNSIATASATSFVQQHNVLSAATVSVQIPPASGPHAGNSQYVEVLVSNSVPTRFIQVLGVGSSQTVTARAVAGQEGTAVAAGVIALDRNARPGIELTGNGSLIVNGTVLVNSEGGGLNESGQPINNGGSGSAITTSGNGSIYAHDVVSVGGVNDISKIMNYDTSNSQSPLHTGAVVQPDPYQYLSSPTTLNGAVATDFGIVKLSGNQNVTLSPGVYTSIETSANVNVHLDPGIYVITGGGLTMTGNSTLTGDGVMLYNTGSDYNVNTGLPDSGDGTSSPPAPAATQFGGVSITGNATLNLTPFSDPSNPFDGMVLYQRRLNTEPLKLAGNGSSDVLTGTVYAKWAPLDLSGNGTFNSQFVVKEVDITGNGTLTLDVTGQPLALSHQVFLVE